MARVLSKVENSEMVQYEARCRVAGWVCDIIAPYEGPGTSHGYSGACLLDFGNGAHWLMMSQYTHEQSFNVILWVSKKGKYDKITAEFSPEDLADRYTLAFAMADLLERLSASIVHNKAVIRALNDGAGVARRVVKTMREKQDKKEVQR